MCGIFGLIRNSTAPNPHRASAAFVELGRLAVERGRDAAGFAMVYDGDYEPGTPTLQHLTSHETCIGNTRIIKATKPFTALWDDETHQPRIADAKVILGHTRWATQGKKDDLTNASPLIVGNLVGTHNGDVTKRTVTQGLLVHKHGDTDTEVLYAALHAERNDRRKITKVLADIHGRAALAWVDRAKPDRVYLGRAALSPLALAWDREGNLYWASNPRWFRDVDAMFDGAIGFCDIILVAEGTLLTVELRGGTPIVADSRRYTPKARASDSRLSDAVVWRGFDASDIAVDKAQMCHKTMPAAKTTAWTSSKAKTTTRRTTKRSTKSWIDDDYKPLWETTHQSTLDEAFAALDEEPDTDTLEYNDFEDEVADAVLAWAEEGCPARVIDQLNAATATSARIALVDQYQLSCLEALDKFQEELDAWVQEGWNLNNSPEPAAVGA